MLNPAQRTQAVEILLDAERTRKQATQLSTTFPEISIEDSVRNLVGGGSTKDGGRSHADRPQDRPHVKSHAGFFGNR